MRTFQEIAENAGGLNSSREDVNLAYAMVAELAETMHRLEYNLAFQMAHNSLGRIMVDERTRGVLVDTWLGNLRAELP